MPPVNLLLTDGPGHDGRLRLPLGEQLVVGVVVLDPTILRQVNGEKVEGEVPMERTERAFRIDTSKGWKGGPNSVINKIFG
jgi:hypothetical protein